MGKRGPSAKPPDVAQGHRNRGLVVVDNEKAMEAPPPPSGLLAQTRRDWHTYWESDVASLAEDVDLPALRRLFRMYDQHERAMRVVRKALTVKGSMGQIRVNPLADYAAKLDTQILRLENEVGVTPMARQRLGIAVGEAILTAAEANRMANDDGEAGESGEVVEAELLDEWRDAADSGA
jgi:P27 family predicted phage terminase small subunit|tara:strand:+ start:9 stop:545 length:537 start_codon:yes stop_codon:yes gene_type:complete